MPWGGDLQSAFIFMTDAALEKCVRGSYKLDLVIHPSRWPGSDNSVSRWGSSFAVPVDRVID